MISSVIFALLRRMAPVLIGTAILFWTVILLAQSAETAGTVRVPRVLPPRGTTSITFNKEIVRILQDNCQKCHHEGDIAPFPLMSYQDAFTHRVQIVTQTSSRTMPPWHVRSTCAAYEDDPSLSDADIQTLSKWVEQGAPEGDPKDLPAPLTFSSSWKLGEPDEVMTMSQPYTPDFSRGDIYRCFVLPTGLTEDRYVSAVEISPGSRAMVHHIILFVDTGNSARDLDAKEPGPGYTCFGGPGFTAAYNLGGWVPGNAPRPLPDGIGMPLPKNSTVVMQVHYSARSGVVEPDQTTLALHFSKKPVQKRLLTVPVVNTKFTIPAGSADYEVKASIPFIPFAAHLLEVTPHMHLLGQKMTVTATLPGGEQVCLVDVPDWDFHWQGTYTYKNPIAIPIGSRVDLSASYDNSSDNPANPNNPPKAVSWGENTTDEMCIAFLGYTVDAENLTGASGALLEFAASANFFEEAWRKLAESYLPR